MKKLYTFFFVLFIINEATGQQNVGIGTVTPNTSAKLDIVSTTSGLLIPRMTSSERNLIASPAKGLMVFITTDSSFYFYDGAWKRIQPSNESWNTKGNNGTDTTFNFIGTIDNKPLKFAVNNIRAGILDPVTFNTGLGVNSLASYKAGIKNTAVGVESLYSNITGNNNTANGYRALFNLGLPQAAGFFNAGTSYTIQSVGSTDFTLIGAPSNTVGIAFIATGIGTGTGTATPNTRGNSAFGYQSLYFNVQGGNNTAVGDGALYANFASDNTAVGFNALGSNTSGSNNVALGAEALSTNLIGVNNTAGGNKALYWNNSGNNNAAFGKNTLYSNISGEENSAIGAYAMYSNTGGVNNSAIGAFSLYNVTSGSFNTASGSEALKLDVEGSFNTANGFQSLYSNSTGANNTATGAQSMYSVKTASNNTALGHQSLYSDTSGNFNTAIGEQSLYSNSNGTENTAIGNGVMYSNTTAFFNTAIGSKALFQNTTGAQNTAIGTQALFLNNGSNNIGIGFYAGNQITTGSYNIEIGSSGNAADNNTIRIGNGNQTKTFMSGIWGTLVAGGVPVYVDGSGQLGTNPSSARFKDDINDMGNMSNDIYNLRPVTFRYKEAIANGDRSIQYGLIAEEVEAVDSNLVAYDNEGRIFTVKYHLLVPLMLNELQKEHTVNQNQDETIKLLQKEVTELKQLMVKRKRHY